MLPYKDNLLNKVEFGTLLAAFVAVPWQKIEECQHACLTGLGDRT